MRNIKKIIPFEILLIDRKKAGTAYPAWIFLFISFLLLTFVGYIAKKFFPFIIPPCGLHKLTGIPCPTCGFTRMVFALLELNFKEALSVQPFLFFVVIFFVLWIFGGIVALICNKFLYVEIPKFWQRNLWIPLLILFILNYIYLLYSGV
ncbi:MAG: DUF2752 domain-containing protein [Acidobacteria bacterium]|nr:DUF2752 domain-containing protein [Acidobacteriota bacterium]